MMTADVIEKMLLKKGKKKFSNIGTPLSRRKRHRMQVECEQR